MNRFFSFLALGVILLSACGRPHGQPDLNEVELAPSEVLDFDTLFSANCAGCHGENGRGGAAIALANPVYLAIADDRSIRNVIANGVDNLVEGHHHRFEIGFIKFQRKVGAGLQSRHADALAFDFVRLESMRGNNMFFTRATVFHELVPGHHMQQFMTQRFRPYRSMFSTPFWTEGMAFYWEMLLWDLGFTHTPEQRIGALVWRMHRCARIIFSLSFHIGKMKALECVHAKERGHAV